MAASAPEPYVCRESQVLSIIDFQAGSLAVTVPLFFACDTLQRLNSLRTLRPPAIAGTN